MTDLAYRIGRVMTFPARTDRAGFAVHYDGPALSEHWMDVRDLTPSILALADMFRLANETLNPGEPPVTLAINATADGSFAVDLAVMHSIGSAITGLFSSGPAVATANLLGYIAGPAGIYALFLARRQANSERRQADGSVIITTGDNATIVFAPEVVQLGELPAMRAHARSVAAPLEKDGIDTVDFRPAPRANPFVTIRKTDLDALAVEETGEPDRDVVTDFTYEQTLAVVTAAFESGRSWRFADGSGAAAFPAKLTDEHFLGKIDRREILFGKNDEIRARVRLYQYRERGVLHTERSVVEVLAHAPATITGNLFDVGLMEMDDDGRAE